MRILLQIWLFMLGLAVVIPAYPQQAQNISGNEAGDQPVAVTPLLSPSSASELRRLTLDEAWHLAEQANPMLRTAKANLAGAEGQYKDAQSVLWNNPVLSSERTRRRVVPTGLPDQRFGEWNVGITQTFEIAGQRSHRRDATQFDLEATREDIAEARRELRAAIELRFAHVLGLQKRIELERDGLKLIEDVEAAVGKRVRAGEDSRLDGNLASVEAERARNQLALLNEQLTEARAELAAIMQLPPATLPEAVGDLAVTSSPYSLADLLAQVAARPKLRSFDLREQAARSKLNLERASVYPDVTVGLTTGREGPGDARERLTTLSVSVPLPLFKRNAAGIGRATTELAQAQIERQAATRDAEAQIRALWQKLESLRIRAKRLTESVLPRLDENKQLSTTSFRAGEIGLLQLVVVNRQLIDARRDYLDAIAEFMQTRIALEQAAGLSRQDRP